MFAYDYENLSRIARGEKAKPLVEKIKSEYEREYKGIKCRSDRGDDHRRNDHADIRH